MSDENIQTLNVTLDDDDQELDVQLDSYNVPIVESIVHIDTTAHWNAQTTLISENEHIYVYSDYQTIDGEPVPGIKVGDGTSYLIDLPFVSGNEDAWNDHIQNTTIHVTSTEKTFWNNKVSCFISAANENTLVFSRTESEG